METVNSNSIERDTDPSSDLDQIIFPLADHTGFLGKAEVTLTGDHEHVELLPAQAYFVRQARLSWRALTQLKFPPAQEFCWSPDPGLDVQRSSPSANLACLLAIARSQSSQWPLHHTQVWATGALSETGQLRSVNTLVHELRGFLEISARQKKRVFIAPLANYEDVDELRDQDLFLEREFDYKLSLKEVWSQSGAALHHKPLVIWVAPDHGRELLTWLGVPLPEAKRGAPQLVFVDVSPSSSRREKVESSTLKDSRASLSSNKYIIALLALLSFTTLYSLFTSPAAVIHPLCPRDRGFYFQNNEGSSSSRGGFVSETATLDVDPGELFIGPESAICGSTRIKGKSTIKGGAVLRGDVKVYSDTVIDGRLLIEGAAEIGRGVTIRGQGHVLGPVKIQDNVTITGSDIELRGDLEIPEGETLVSPRLIDEPRSNKSAVASQPRRSKFIPEPESELDPESESESESESTPRPEPDLLMSQKPASKTSSVSRSLCTRRVSRTMASLRRVSLNGVNDIARMLKDKPNFNISALYHFFTTRSSHITFLFKPGQANLDRAQWAENRKELSLMLEATDDPRRYSFFVIGLANRTGSIDHNRMLAARRIKALTDMIQSNFNVTHHNFFYTFTGAEGFQFKYNMMEKLHMITDTSRKLIQSQWSHRDRLVNEAVIILFVPCVPEMCEAARDEWGQDRICDPDPSNDLYLRECEPLVCGD